MTNNEDVKVQKLTAKDFASDQDVRWCPGCGDYSILAQVQRSLPDIIGADKENLVWVSGIGCSSRFPYYMNTYGFHGIHGRAHACRKNVDIKIMLFNNRIYGLTKGQYSPTSERGKVTKTTPYGSVDYPFNAISLAIGSEASFIARSIDRNPKHLQEMIKRAGEHVGTAFLEIYQNCNIFNDGAFSLLTEKETKDDNILVLEHKKPMVFGKDLDKGIKLDGAIIPVIVDLTNGKYSKDDLLVHHEHSREPILSTILAHITDHPDFPTPIGVFRQRRKETYDGGIARQITEVTEKKGTGDLKKTLFGTNTWEVN
jgi:2-oxoglutarate ferredoxin oxidoreductase subunit beta